MERAILLNNSNPELIAELGISLAAANFKSAAHRFWMMALGRISPKAANSKEVDFKKTSTRRLRRYLIEKLMMAPDLNPEAYEAKLTRQEIIETQQLLQ